MENKQEKHKFMEDRIFEVSMSEQRVLLLPEEKLKVTKSGIHLPETAEDDTPKVCTVMRVGKGDKDTPMLYQPGQKVMISKYSGKEITFNLNGHGYHTYIVTNQIDVMFTLEEKGEEK